MARRKTRRRNRPECSGIAAGSSHPHRNPQRYVMHLVVLQAEQLGVVGIRGVTAPTRDWLDAGIDQSALIDAFSPIVPRGSTLLAGYRNAPDGAL